MTPVVATLAPVALTPTVAVVAARQVLPLQQHPAVLPV